jgi:rare lipoprotein A (peptidoglycan hydrolase)
VVVRINDRGPAKRLKRGIDLSKAAFKALAPLELGLIKVKLIKRKGI